MGLKIMKDPSGAFRKTWYARTMSNGRRIETNLDVPLRGTVPLDANGEVDLNRRGDAAYEESKAAAREALRVWQRKLRRKEEPEKIQKKYHRMRTGESNASPHLDDMYDKWLQLKRSYTPTDERKRNARRTFRRFTTFARAHAKARNASCETIDEITAEIASAFFEHLRKTYAWGTVKDQMHMMSKAWERWHVERRTNPFSDIVLRNRELGNTKIPRRPLSQQELANLFRLTQGNKRLHELVICAACTGMRIGDVCNLKWSNVDLKEGLIDVITAKAGQQVTIPIFRQLRLVFEARLAESDEQDIYVFPESMRRYNFRTKKGTYSLRTAITRSVKPPMARAVFGDKEPPEDAHLATDVELTTEDILKRITKARFAESKKERLSEIIRRRAAGESYSRIAIATGARKSAISEDLKQIELLTGASLRPGQTRAKHGSQADLLIKTRQERTVGCYSASILGWHTLRASFVVLALENGVPLSDIQMIVGHGTVEVTLQYVHPTKKIVAERVRNQMRGTVLDYGTYQTPTPVQTAHLALSPDTILQSLSVEQQKELARKLLGALGL